MSEPNPCPFCGFKDTLQERNEHGWPIVRCSVCGACGPCTNHKPEDAVTAWNRRHQITPQAGEAEPVVYMYEENGETYFGHPDGHHPPDATPLYRAAPPRPVCPHLRSSDEGTQWCDLAARVGDLSPVAAWQDIETAPKHYTPIILKQGSTVGEGCHATHIGWEFFNSRYVMRRDPTHWQPLPPDSPGAGEETEDAGALPPRPVAPQWEAVSTALVTALDRIRDILSGDEYMEHADRGIDEIVNEALALYHAARAAPPDSPGVGEETEDAGALPPRPVAPAWQPKAQVYAWLGYWRDKMPPEAVEKLQNILGPLNDSSGD